MCVHIGYIDGYMAYLFSCHLYLPHPCSPPYSKRASPASLRQKNASSFVRNFLAVILEFLHRNVWVQRQRMKLELERVRRVKDIEFFLRIGLHLDLSRIQRLKGGRRPRGWTHSGGAGAARRRRTARRAPPARARSRRPPAAARRGPTRAFEPSPESANSPARFPFFIERGTWT